MSAERSPEPDTDREPAAPPADEPRPTFQTPASEAADVAARAVAERVAAAAAANAAAAEEAAAREADAARQADEATAAAESARVEASADDMAAIDAGSMPIPETQAAAPANASTLMAGGEASGSTGWVLPAATAGPPSAAMTAATAASPSASMSALEVATATTVDGTAGTAPADAGAATAKPWRRPILLAWARRLVIFVLSVALLAGGILLGQWTFQRTRPVPAGLGAIEFAQAPADVAKEFIAGLAAGDADAVRSSLMEQPNKDLGDVFRQFNIQKVTGVETLGTSVNGTRSATEVLLHTVTTSGNTFDINLIILVQGNQIEGFR